MNTTNELTIGLDLGDRRHHVCVLDGAGEILAEESLSNTRACPARQRAILPHRLSAARIHP